MLVTANDIHARSTKRKVRRDDGAAGIEDEHMARERDRVLGISVSLCEDRKCNSDVS